MVLDIKSLREKADPKISQKELALRIGKTQSQVSRYEENPEKIPVDVMVQICVALGVDFASVINGMNNTAPEGIDAGKPYADLRADIGCIRVYSERALPVVQSSRPDILEALRGILDECSRKPRLMLVGAFDSGKSTIANALLGEKYLPTNYTPATRVVTFVRHKEEKPTWLAEDVLMLDSGFNPLMWCDESHCLEHKLAAGNSMTLKDYGTHDGDKASSDAEFAIVFLDLPILHSCEIIDLPGFENTTTDTLKATSQLAQADLVVFACPYISFMGAGDIVRLSEVLRGMPHFCSFDSTVKPLENLFIVATHTSLSVSDDDLAHIIRNACRRIETQLNEFTLTSFSQEELILTADLLNSRTFTFFSEAPKRRKAFEESVQCLLSETLPIFKGNAAEQEILTFKKTNTDRLEAQLTQYEEATRRNKSREDSLKRIAEESDRISNKAKSMKAKILQKIRNKYLPDSLNSAKEIHNQFCDRKLIQDMIKEANFRDKSEAKQYAPGLIWEHLYGRISKRIATISEAFTTDEISPFVGMYESAAMALGSSLLSRTDTVDFNYFNAKGAFLGGLTGLGVVGALSLWAASLGNLGAYIIAAKLGTVLATLGITIGGGTATLVSTMAALGGPAGIAVGIVLIGTVLGMALFKSWERKLAEAIVKQLKKRNTYEGISNSISSYWKDTENAFISGAENLEKQWKVHIADLESVYIERDNLNTKISTTKAVRDFVAGIPWKSRSMES